MFRKKKGLSFYGFIILLISNLSLLSSCEIVQELEFNEQGGGRYTLGFDMSEMMKMGMSSKDSTQQKPIDTIIKFADYLELKKDSISKLPKKDQQKLADLKDFDLVMKVDTLSDQLKMTIGYQFKNVEDLKLFSKKLNNVEIQELKMFKNQMKDKQKTKDTASSFPDFNESFETKFNKNFFSRKITQKAYLEAVEKKDTSLTKDNPMVDMIRFKQRIKFPYRIKEVSNTNAKILSDFKGVEIEGNLYDINNNPNIFDIDVVFDTDE